MHVCVKPRAFIPDAYGVALIDGLKARARNHMSCLLLKAHTHACRSGGKGGAEAERRDGAAILEDGAGPRAWAWRVAVQKISCKLVHCWQLLASKLPHEKYCYG